MIRTPRVPWIAGPCVSRGWRVGDKKKQGVAKGFCLPACILMMTTLVSSSIRRWLAPFLRTPHPPLVGAHGSALRGVTLAKFSFLQVSGNEVGLSGRSRGPGGGGGGGVREFPFPTWYLTGRPAAHGWLAGYLVAGLGAKCETLGGFSKDPVSYAGSSYILVWALHKDGRQREISFEANGYFLGA